MCINRTEENGRLWKISGRKHVKEKERNRNLGCSKRDELAVHEETLEPTFVAMGSKLQV